MRKRALSWKELAELLRKNLSPDVEQDESVDPLWLAELYRQRHGAEALHRAIEEAIPSSLQPGALHRVLFKVPWHSILTTNYDTLLERAQEPFGEIRSCVEDSDLVLSECSRALEVIHLHGVISRPETIVLAYEDYRQYPIRHPGFLAKVRQLFLQHPVMFVGFSATDPNFLQWSGWLTDVVGEFKNPWISLTHVPPRGRALGRYWGTRLQFVGLPSPSSTAFDNAVTSIFETIAAALDDDTFEKSVVARRLLACTTTDAVIKAVQYLIAVGERRGYVGSAWERSKDAILQYGLSRLLELKRVPWREGQSETGRVPSVGLVAEDSTCSHQDVLKEWSIAIGEDWSRWIDLVKDHCRAARWRFDRVPFDNNERNRWNCVWIEIRSSDDEAVVRSSPNNEAVDACIVASSCSPKSPNEHRKLAFFAFEEGNWERAARLYADAARLSQEYDEPQRVRLLTLWSVSACLHGGGVLSTIGDAGSPGVLLHATDTAARDLGKQLRSLPLDEQLAQLHDWECESHQKAEKALFQTFLRPLALPPKYFDRPHSAASDWFEFLEKHWFAQGVVHSAAKALGLNQWLVGSRIEAFETLYRFGSSLPKDLLESHVQRLNSSLGEVASLISVALDFKGSFGRRLAQVTSIGGLLPWLTEDQFDTLRNQLTTLRKQLTDSTGMLTQGTTRVFPRQTHAALDAIEHGCWAWMPISVAFDALCEWTDSRGKAAIAADPFGQEFALISDFDWKEVCKNDDLTRRVPGIVRTILEHCLAAHKSSSRTDIVRQGAWFLIQLWSDGVINVASDNELGRLYGEIVRILPDAESVVISAHWARLREDWTLIRNCVEEATRVPSEDEQNEFTSLRVAAVLAEHCSEKAPSVVALVKRLLNRIRKEHKNSGRDLFAERGGREDNVSPLLAALITAWPIDASSQLLDMASEIIDICPVAVEHFSGIEVAKIGDLRPTVDQNVRKLLRSGMDESAGSAREQGFAAVRAIARAMLPGARWLLDPEIALGLAMLVDSPVSALATYATWALAQWATEGVSAHEDELLRLIVVPILRRAMLDRRLGVAVNGVRGLHTVRVVHPDWVREGEVEWAMSDKRIAMQRVFQGNSNTGIFAEVL